MRKAVGLLLVALLFLLPAASASADPAGTDLMLVVAHPGDEYLYFGGIVPYYAGECGYTLTVVYLTSRDETQRAEAAAGLAALGVDAPPVFGAFPDVYADTLENAKKYWKEADVTEFIRDQIETHRPAVVVTHDANGEYGSGMHRLAAACTVGAVKKAAKAWQVSRVYQHLADGTPVVIDRAAPLIRYQGMTALAIDRLGYESYSEQYRYRITIEDTGYTAPSYGVVYTASGERTQADNDLFSGVDRARLNGPHYAVPDATPTPAATPAPTATAVPATASLEPETPPPAQPAARGGAALLGAFPLGCAVFAAAALLGALAALVLAARHKKSVLPRLAVAILLLIAVCLLLFSARRAWRTRPATEAANAPTPVPTQSPVPVTPLPPPPTAAPTPEPTPAPHAWAEYFRQEGDPAEVIVIDPENDHWEYRSDTLSILIDRRRVQNADGRPIVYCVAHVRQKDGVNAFRAGMRDPGSVTSSGLEQPWHMARRLQAVLAVTGDNMTQAEANIKGLLMRDGKVYSDHQAADTLALYPDLSLRIFSPKEITPEKLLADGVQNTFSFGPTLIRDGVVNIGGTRTKLGATNPRCGIGMVEPGHFIVITVDGRQRDYSQGISIGAFMHLFYTYGCTQAYNLDGGSSTAMVFMGEHLNRHANTESDSQRGWPDAILFGYSEQVPGVDDPIYNKGYGEQAG